jgi:hypothetical protein
MRSYGADTGLVRSWLEDVWRNGEVVADHDGHLVRIRPRRLGLLAQLSGYARRAVRAARRPLRALR